MARRATTPVMSALTAALLVFTAGCSVLGGDPDPQPAAEAFARHLKQGIVRDDALVDPADARLATDQIEQAVDALGTRPRVSVIGPVVATEATSTSERDAGRSSAAHLRIGWPLPSGTWAYDTGLPLVLTDDGWKVDWRPSILHPRLGRSLTLRLRTTAPPRGPILSGDGTRLFRRRPVVTVFVQPARMRSVTQVTAALRGQLGIDPEPLRRRIAAAEPDDLVEVVTLRMDDYAPLRSTLQPVPGLVFRRDDLLLTPTRSFARAVLGRVGAPTAEVLGEAGFGFDADDTLGLSGLQRQFQHELSGTPGVEVLTVDANGEAVQRLHRSRPVPGEALRTTLDPAVQRAADAALAPVDRTAALVALRPASGQVLAVAHSPDGGGTNLAFSGRYPPGSTFKVVSGAALVNAGRSPGSKVRCPPTALVGGRRFSNAGGTDLGTTTLTRAFARSCNTTFAAAATDIDHDMIRAAAAKFGMGQAWDPGVDAYVGQVPPAADDAEEAATLIGQGRVLVSPLLMASVAAAVQDGRWRPPVLLPDHARSDHVPAPLDATVRRALRRMMRAAVTRGTARALADVPGPAVIAKTGTAEFGSHDPPHAHAWTIAARRDIAVAVLVEDGGSGGAVAAPVVARFLSAL